VCARVGNQWSRGVVTAQVRTDVVRSLRHQRRDLHQSTYPVPLGRLGLILLSERAYNKMVKEKLFQVGDLIWKTIFPIRSRINKFEK
jgi:hypothetical protein